MENNNQPETAYVSINVMQALVEEKVDKCMAEADMCTCPRCRIDVTALALSLLPSKYVVLHANDTLPMLTVYANRYSAVVTTQLMAACQRIKENPRHGNNDKRGNIAFIRD
ncbi:MAG: late competence development ComFB family protein [Firmicutes bacterium]|nr:late competence development ComFB family protein [Bacillota bacterium]